MDVGDDQVTTWSQHPCEFSQHRLQAGHVDQGQRMGLIRFGSRVDVFLPVNATVRVKIGDLTVAGSSVIAEMPNP